MRRSEVHVAGNGVPLRGSSRLPHYRKGSADWQSFAPQRRDCPAVTVVYFCTAVCSRTSGNRSVVT